MSPQLPSVVHVMTHATTAVEPQLDSVMLLGFLTALLTLVFYIEQNRCHGAVLGVAICSAAMAGFAFLEGVWPLGIVQIATAIVAFRKWRGESRRTLAKKYQNPWKIESRLTRLFGPEPSDHPVKGEWQ
jgi:hypothetical protein